jgi:hypothetical protein
VFIIPQTDANRCLPALFRTADDAVVASVPPSNQSIDVPFVGDLSPDNSVNYFGTISISKDWRQWQAVLEYSRTASNSSGLSGSTILDQLTGTVIWRPSQLWTVTFNAIYSTQTALNETTEREITLRPELESALLFGFIPITGAVGVPVEVRSGSAISSELELTTTYLTLDFNRRVTNHLTLIGSATYWQQQSDGLLDDTRINDIQFSLGFTWNFEPIPL